MNVNSFPYLDGLNKNGPMSEAVAAVKAESSQVWVHSHSLTLYLARSLLIAGLYLTAMTVNFLFTSPVAAMDNSHILVASANNVANMDTAKVNIDDSNIGAVSILAYGDSLTAGYGLGPGEGFVDQLQVWLEAALERPVKVTNAGVSGDTSTGGRSRLNWSLSPFGSEGPDLVIMELGANDGLRGVDPRVTRENMDIMLGQLSERNIDVLVTGMLAPPNLGPDYAAEFNNIYPDLAEKYGYTLYPFFLEGVAADPDLNQSDGIHPTKEGVAIIISKIGPVVQGLLAGHK